MQLNFSGVNPDGFQQVDEGEYIAKTVKWQRIRKDDTANNQLWIDFEIICPSFEGETVRHFKTVTEKSRKFVLQLLVALGIVTKTEAAEAAAGNDLVVEFHYADSEQKEIKGVTVNGDKRGIKNLKAVIVVEHGDNGRARVAEVKPYEGKAQSLNPTAGAQQQEAPPQGLPKAGDGKASKPQPW